MEHKCYISFKKEDIHFKLEIQKWKEQNKVNMIDKSMDTPIASVDEDYIMRKIREDYLSDSTVTIFLIGSHSSEVLGWDEQKYIKRELQASLYNGKGNTRNGILGVVLPQMYDSIYQGMHDCPTCGNSHNWIAVNDNTVIKEFSRNYFLNSHGKCSYDDEDRYCVLVKWCDFSQTPNTYIEQAFAKRSQSIANEVIVRPK